jgi:hypothetical protein
MDLDMEHEHGNVEWKRTFSMDMDIQYGYRNTA